MNRTVRWAVAGTLCASAALAAQQQAPAPYAPLEFLVGHCWSGTFPDGKSVDEHCFEWMYDRKFIRDRHAVRGGEGTYEGESIYSWDPATKRISFRYWSVDGLVMDGTVEPRGTELAFPARYATSAGMVELRAVWTRIGNDRYRAVQTQQTAGEWKTVFDVTYKKVR